MEGGGTFRWREGCQRGSHRYALKLIEPPLVSQDELWYGWVCNIQGSYCHVGIENAAKTFHIFKKNCRRMPAS